VTGKKEGKVNVHLVKSATQKGPFGLITYRGGGKESVRKGTNGSNMGHCNVTGPVLSESKKKSRPFIIQA